MRRPALQCGEEQPGDDNGESAEPDHHLIDPAFEVRKPQIEVRKPYIEPLFQLSQIGLGRDVVMDRVIDVGRDALGVVAFETGALQRRGSGSGDRPSAHPGTNPHEVLGPP